ncbi:MAG TPA: MBL fold metallo-hydrolase [Bacillota bacterium]|nr:MBL fold metallo-hydrolase [Bacillota bacterium]
MGYFRVTNPLPSVYHLEDVRGVFATLLIGSQKALLVDTAMGIGNIAKEVSGITTLPLTVVNTHGHTDHTLGNYQFPKVYLARGDWELAKMCGAVEVKRRLLALSAIVPPDFDQEAYLNYKYDNLVPLEEGTVFDLGELSVRPVPLPSHSPGSMGFLCPELGLLMSGDSVAPLVCLVFPESSSVSEHIKMLKKVKELPFSRILSSHSERLIPREEIELYLKCAGSVDRSKTVKYKSPLFPDYPGRMFFCGDSVKKGEFAAIVYSESKLTQ